MYIRLYLKYNLYVDFITILIITMTNQKSEQKHAHLIEDPFMPSQKYVCISFVEPENIEEKKQVHMTNEFIKSEITTEFEAYSKQVTHYINVKLNDMFESKFKSLEKSLNTDDQLLLESLKTMKRTLKMDENTILNECSRNFIFSEDEIMDKYQVFRSSNYAELEYNFNQLNNNVTSIKGVKCRGTFTDYEQAKKHALFLQKEVEPAHNVIVAENGKWMPFNPSPDTIANAEYANDELNNLMKDKEQNRIAKNQHFRERTEQMKEQASKKAEKAKKTRKRRKRDMYASNDHNKSAALARARITLNDRKVNKQKTEIDNIIDAGAVDVLDLNE